MIELNKIYNEDCLEGMKRIPDGSIDMILCDLPYGTTNCKWDEIIPFQHLWKEYNRVIKDNGAIVLTASQPFTSALVMSNPKGFKHSWVWHKKNAGNLLVAKYQPLKTTEDVLVFSKKGKRVNYYPIFTRGPKDVTNYKLGKQKGDLYAKIKSGTFKLSKTNKPTDARYPKHLIEFSNAYQHGKIHPTQKPVALFEYLIKTYTNKGDTVLDNCMGSGTTAIACLNIERNFIGFETNKEYYDKSLERIKNNETQLDLFEEEK
ncbi:DNA-methyltransferase [Lactococcus formosensis]|uniref:DNA-methyltransferase n=1 Tax=Lactococcus formosensis TaxID=1281486 RepID=UPI002550A0ED|nr:site-specific DNA-methyltransferase [Lactococcus formosensis]